MDLLPYEDEIRSVERSGMQAGAQMVTSLDVYALLVSCKHREGHD